MSMIAPAGITNNIKTIEGVRYKTPPNGRFPHSDAELFQIREYPSGEDHLIVFEGGTGSTTETNNPAVGLIREPSWSLMGFVVVDAMQHTQEIRVLVEQEASGLANIFLCSKGLPNERREAIHQQLIAEICNMTNHYRWCTATLLRSSTRTRCVKANIAAVKEATWIFAKL